MFLLVAAAAAGGSVDWATMIYTLVGGGGLWLMLQSVRNWGRWKVFIHTRRGRSYTSMTNQIESRYETRQTQLKEEVAELRAAISDRDTKIAHLEEALAILRAEVKALPAIQALTERVDRGFERAEQGFERVLEAIGGKS